MAPSRRIHTALYVICRDDFEIGSVIYALRRFAQQADNLLIVCPPLEAMPAQAAALAALVQDLGATTLPGQNAETPLAGYKTALHHLMTQPALPTGPVMIASSAILGPLDDVSKAVLDDLMDPAGADLWSSYYHDLSQDMRLTLSGGPTRVAHLDMALFSPALMQDPSFAAFWQAVQPRDKPWADFKAGALALGQMLHGKGARVATLIDDLSCKTADPRYFEIHRLLDGPCWCLPAEILTMDPLLHDLNAIYLREAISALRARSPALYDVVIRYATRKIPMRELATITEDYAVISPVADSPGRQAWEFGPVAVFIHAYYAQMMPDFWTLIQRLPGAPHLFLTTASADDAETIRTFLSDRGWPETRFEVREVEQNRGRDMSSLFITWRDVILDNRFNVALRLHSKRTPQVSPQVSAYFRDHLFENLIASKDHVRNILDTMEAQPDIGMVTPPAIHIGFGTLGHAWFNNRRGLTRLAAEMGLDVPLDDATPVAPYGTMYWFRTDALRRMFEWKWTWEAYNPEPGHVNGGLAHIQERLIGYCVQDAGYRTLQVMTPDMAARNYAKLEYKLQLLSSLLKSTNAYLQREELEHQRATFRIRTYNRLRSVYGRILERWPGSRRRLGGLRRLAQRVLLGDKYI